MAILTKYPTSNAVVLAGGWTNPTNAYADDTSYATAAPGKNAAGDGIVTEWSGFDFSAIADGSTINSIYVYANGKLSASDSLHLWHCYVMDGASTLVDVDYTPLPITDTDYAIGGGDVKASVSLTNLKSSTFKVRIGADRGNTNNAYTHSLDHIRVVVDYVTLLNQQYSGTGGATLSGTATKSKDKTPVGAGGTTFSGAADKVKEKVFAAAGGITISGAATTSTEVLKIYDGSGGLTVSGAADAFFASIREVTGTGGVVLSGAGAIEQLKVPVVSGGIALTGSAISEFMHSHEVVGSGGLVFTGDAALAKEVIVTVVASGGVVFSGVATVLNEVLKTYDGSGGVVFSGAAGTLASKEWAFDGSGSLAFAGSGVYSRDMVFVPSGGLTLIGAAELTKWKVAAATGGVVLAGTGATSTLIIRTVSGAGGTIFGGSIEAAYEVVPTCSGGVVFSGAATIQWDPTENIEEYSGTGTITFSGAATTEFATTVTTIYPTTVVDASTYTRETGSSDPADLLAGLTSPDAYYDRSPTRPATTTLKVGFITLNARPGVMLYYEYGKDMADGERIDQTIDLRKAGAVVKTATHNDVGVRPISGEIDLSDLTLSGDYEVWLTDTEVI